MPTPFENFVNTELPKRIATNESPTTPQAGDIPIYTGVGLLTEAKTVSEAGLATETFATNAANTAETNAKSYADDLITSIYKFQTTYNPQTTGNFPTTANTVGGVAIKKGFTWVVSGVTGQYTFQGVTVDNGDTLLALVDNASATSAADWHITEANLGYTPENQNNKDTDGTLAANSDTKYPSQKAVKTYADTKQAALADVITADTYGSSTQWPAITFNAKGIATGVTLHSPALTEANFAVQKTGSPSVTASWVLTALTGSVTHTYPNANINFGDLSFVASTNSNTLSGTRTHIVGGSGNTVSGTDVALVNSSTNEVSGTDVALVNTSNSYFTSCTNVQANNVWWVGQASNPPSKNRISYIGSSFSQPVVGLSNLYSAALGSVQCLYTNAVSANGTSYNCTLDGSNTLGATNCAPVVIAGTIGAAVHDIEFIVAIGTGGPLVPVRHLIAKRRVYAQLKAGAVGSSSTVTIDTDTFVGDAATGSTSVGVTVDFANNRLVPTISGTYGAGQESMQASVRITSHFNRK